MYMVDNPPFTFLNFLFSVLIFSMYYLLKIIIVDEGKIIDLGKLKAVQCIDI